MNACTDITELQERYPDLCARYEKLHETTFRSNQATEVDTSEDEEANMDNLVALEHKIRSLSGFERSQLPFLQIGWNLPEKVQ